ncbi:hypothetical protein ACQEXU_07805 [Vibrio sp. TRT 21S02]|uniref:hypothetical protein n=1 Tax=unclassified Vibrio TaxID=2614977 RepID=UPI003CE99706
MIQKISLFVLSTLLSIPVYANTVNIGKIASLSFYGSGINEKMFITIEPKVSKCAYSGAYVLSSADKPGLTSALLTAFAAQKDVVVHGTGECHSSWKNHEELNYAEIRR